MEDLSKEIKSIYELASTYLNKRVSYEQSLRKAIVEVLEVCDTKNKLKFLGEDLYLDFLNYSKRIQNQDFMFFEDDIKNLEPQFSKMSESQKQHYIEAIFKGKNAIKNTNFVIAERLRSENFSTSELESILLSNGIIIKKNKS